MTSVPASTAVAVRALQVLALLSVLCLAFQFVTAGGLLGGGGSGAESAHAAGAVALHVLTGAAAAAAVVARRVADWPWWLAALATAVFVLGFAQAYWGSHGPLAVHVPGAMALVVGAVWLLVASLGRRTAGPRS